MMMMMIPPEWIHCCCCCFFLFVSQSEWKNWTSLQAIMSHFYTQFSRRWLSMLWACHLIHKRSKMYR
jgi:hypothetical protein